MIIGEPDRFIGKLIGMGSFDDRITRTSEVSVALIVGNDKHHVGLGSKESDVDKQKTKNSEERLNHEN